LEGDLPEAFIESLDADGVGLLPGLSEMDGVCDCGDFHMPCAHMASVHNVIAEALDGDPFLLLTLRGLDREQLLTRLRRAWGDPHPVRGDTLVADESPPDHDDWGRSPEPLPKLAFNVVPTSSVRAGVYALGPAPGRSDLGTTLAPLYQEGAAAAAELALGDPADFEDLRPFSNWSGFQPGKKGAPPRVAAKARAPQVEGTAPIPALTELLVNLLAEAEGAKSKELALQLGQPVLAVRQELLDLEKLGIVYRTGQTRGTRWWLG
ncbi:MAG: hypothetical protein AB8H79_12000, partial [Myxococcota bacterium]